MDVGVMQLDPLGTVTYRLSHSIKGSVNSFANPEFLIRDQHQIAYAESWDIWESGYRRELVVADYYATVNSTTPKNHGFQQTLHTLESGGIYLLKAQIKVSSIDSGEIRPLYTVLHFANNTDLAIPGPQVKKVIDWTELRYGYSIPSDRVVSSAYIGARLHDFKGYFLCRKMEISRISVSGNFIASGKIQGIYQLAQRIIKQLFTTPGTDIKNLADGGGFFELAPSNINTVSKEAHLSDLRTRVMNCVSQVRERQALNSKLSSYERLASMSILESYIDAGIWHARFQLKSEAGETLTLGW